MSRSGDVIGASVVRPLADRRVHRAQRAARRRHRRAGSHRDRQCALVRRAQAAPPRKRTRRALAGRAHERIEGRVSRRSCRTSCARRSARSSVGRRSCAARADEKTLRAGARHDRAQCAHSGAADRRPARHEPDHRRARCASISIRWCRRRSSKRRSIRCDRRPMPRTSACRPRSIRPPARSPAIRIACSRSSGTCSRMRSSSRPTAAR